MRVERTRIRLADGVRHTRSRYEYPARKSSTRSYWSTSASPNRSGSSST